MHALAAMIQEVLHAEQSSLAALARRGGLSTSRMQWYADVAKPDLPEIPRPATLRALATALQRSERDVLIAAASAAGINVTTELRESALARRLPPSVVDLTSEDAHLLAQLAGRLGEARRAAGDRETSSQ